MKRQTSNELAAKAQEWERLAKVYAGDAVIEERCKNFAKEYREREAEAKEIEALMPTI
jgi:hypothetical protein